MTNQNQITLKQINFIKKLDATITEEQIKDFTTIEASKLIRKLLKQIKNNEEQTKKQSKPKEEIKRTHNVKVGDVFYASWGYEQTNLDFFLVTELVGAQSVRVLPVFLNEIEEETMSHGMARDVKFDPKNYTIDTRSVFIKDCEKGDLKRVQVSKWGNNEEYIKIASFASAYKYHGQKLYESWYY
jgi:hypothetical protein